MKLSLCFVVAAAAVAPPKITLDLDESVQAAGFSLKKMAPAIIREHDLKLRQTTGKKVSSQQDWSQRCPAGSSNKKTCPFPQATAVDHGDKNVKVTRRIFLVDKDGQSKNKEVQWTPDNFNKRSTYLFKYDATDDSGNHAEQVVFALILDDKTKPAIAMCGKGHELVQAASTWKLCGSTTASDNIDGSIKKFTYTVKQGKKFLCREEPLAIARQFVNSKTLGTYAVTISTHDKAGIYGQGAQNNVVSVSKKVVVRDTAKCVINMYGIKKLTLECGATYKDAGARATDKMDGNLKVTASGAKPNTHKVGNYVVSYKATDLSKNACHNKRTIRIRDTKKPKCSLLGNSYIELNAGQKYVEPGFTGSDSCGNGNIKKSSKGRVNTRKPGVYTLSYTCADGAGNTKTIRRKVAIADKSKPTMKLVGTDKITTQATTKREWTDPGATCKDNSDGNLNNFVEVSGRTVNLRVAGTYKLTYRCMDISGNSATPLTRTVTVVDTSCPKIKMLGNRRVTVEAGFPYKDAGATASDSLDGDLTSAVWSDGASVDLYKSFKSAQSCHEIKRSYPEATSGTYKISSYARRQFRSLEAWCDMHTVAKKVGKVGFTYVKAPKKGCAWIGLSEAKFVTKSASQKFGKTSLCGPNDEKYNLAHARVAPNVHSHPGKYLVTYHVSDRDGNKECKAPMRVVVVKDTLPPVIKLHLRKKLIHTSAAGLMEESQTSVNGWVIGAIASAVAGVAILGFSSKKTTSVPV